MSFQEEIKKDVEIIKDGLTAEEQFLTGFIRIERFVKRHKIIFLSLLGLVAAVFIGFQGYVAYQQMQKDAANEAFTNLLKNPADKEALSTLKDKNQKLYEAFLLTQAIDKNDKKALLELAKIDNKLMSDLAAYQSAALAAEPVALNGYISTPEPIFRDLALLEQGYLYLTQKNGKKAAESFERIPFQSPVKELSNSLGHYLVGGGSGIK